MPTTYHLPTLRKLKHALDRLNPKALSNYSYIGSEGQMCVIGAFCVSELTHDTLTQREVGARYGAWSIVRWLNEAGIITSSAEWPFNPSNRSARIRTLAQVEHVNNNFPQPLHPYDLSSKTNFERFDAVYAWVCDAMTQCEAAAAERRAKRQRSATV